MKYLDEFVRCPRASDLLALKLFPNAKEITESFAAYTAVRAHLDVDLGDPKVAVLCVGDGHVPRTAAVFAFRSAWTCFSVDPAMRPRKWPVDRLRTYRGRVPGWIPAHGVPTYRRAIVVAVHSHASLRASVYAGLLLAPRVSAVSIPCCFRDDINGADVVYEDAEILSPHRKVSVWSDAQKSS